MNLKIISGTDRPNSNSLRIARYLQGEYRKHGVDADIVNLQDFPTSAVEGGRYADKPEEVEAFIQPVLESDAIVIVCPEYNGGYPGILKLFIDYLPFPESLNKKPISFIGHANGAFGGLRAVEQLQHVVGYRNAHVFPERVFIPRIGKNFDDKEGITDPFQQDLLQEQIKNFIGFVENLKFQDSLET
ncbi:NAD(P)H-dependent oxidoreductase [Balneolaceae bacterium YR4-1]|uniref:NAD(P)H-dependent oxidoreductase n=1 Tax=Halalkalibaculum roseum TaxID=2709311 RepID=A0A6M1SYF4_9BACT|nr:NADPH-dependent FMN reductase [Halalkalibaculum roseum]NGP75587.1 NAD(P)H-dependent oxidoreductase [Halalkalibaculum roseum]